jgi:multidrug efflux pump
MKLFGVLLGRARTVLTIMVVMVAAGFATYVAIPKEADPDIPIPFVFVSIPHPGISPEDAERLLIKPMETKLRTIEGLKEIRAYAAQSAGSIVLEFDVNFDKDQAVLDVREQVDLAKSDLPSDTEEPIVREMNTSLFPVLVVTLSGDIPERQLNEIARRLQDDLEGIPTVLEANLKGQREELLEVVIDPSKLESYNVSQQELINVVSMNNRLVAAGSLDTGRGRFQIKVPGLVETGADVFSLPIKVSGDAVVTLSDVADIRRTFMDIQGYARFNQKPAIAIEILKRGGENIIDNNLLVRELVAEARKSWPAGVNVDFSLDQSSWIYSSLGSLQASIMTAIVLVMIVVVAALGFRSATLVGLAIPCSFLIGFFFLGALGMTVNMMVMFGMVLSVGILVDGAIVVVEFADRKMAEGFQRKEAYALAAHRMFWPIVSSTGTTLAAFIPMLFWPGVPGKFISYLPITLILVLTASLITALIFLPVLGSLFGRAQPGNEGTLKALAASEKGDIRDVPGITGIYAQWVGRLIQHPVRVLSAAIVVSVSVIVAYGYAHQGLEFFINTEPEEGIVLIRGRGNLAADEMRDLVVGVENVVGEVEGVKSLFTQTGSQRGGGPSFGGGSGIPEDTIGRITIELADWQERTRDGWKILQDIRDRTSNFPGVIVEVRAREQGPSVGKPVRIQVASLSPSALAIETDRIRRKLDDMDGLIDIEDSRPLPGIEWELTVDREQAGRFGADVTQVGAAVQLVTNGIKIGEYRPDDVEDEVEIRARFPSDERFVNQLDQLRITTPEGLVPISNFVTRTPVAQVSRIERIDGYRVYNINANVAEGVLGDDKVTEIKTWLAANPADSAVTVSFRGADEERAKSMSFLFNAMLASLFVMAIILLTQFNSFYHSALILSSVIFSTVGVLIGMIVTGQTFSIMMTGTGILALAGIVVNNNIVLIDTYQGLIAQGYEKMDAIIRTAAQRLRPVFLTTITTICGLLPMAFQVNVDFFTRTVTVGGPISYWWVQLATAVVFGLAYATVLTLTITPVMLALPEIAKRRWTTARPVVMAQLAVLRGHVQPAQPTSNETAPLAQPIDAVEAEANFEDEKAKPLQAAE